LNTIQHILPCGSGFAVGASDPLFALLDQDGTPRLTKSGVGADMRAKLGDAFLVSRDGGAVRFGLRYGDANPVLFDLAHATLSENADGSGLAAPRIAGIPVHGLAQQYGAQARQQATEARSERIFAIACDHARRRALRAGDGVSVTRLRHSGAGAMEEAGAGDGLGRERDRGWARSP
jgi:hypothetical protein